MAELLDLPPGFRFHPTDEEIITHYLTPKVFSPGFVAQAIGEADLNKHEPWDLPKRAKLGEKEWYFFSQKDRKYPTGTRTNRATEAGYWKATGKDKEIYRGDECLVGMKKTLVFYRGRAPKGDKTNWVMHEYRLHGNGVPNPNPKDEWAVCRIFHKNASPGNPRRTPSINNIGTLSRLNSFGFVDDLFLLSSSAPPPLVVNPPDSTALELQRSLDEYFSLLADQKYNNNNNEQACASFEAINYTNDDPSPLFCLQNPTTDNPLLRATNHGTYYPRQNAVTGSQETGISTDVNTEISSVVSRQSDDNGDDAKDETKKDTSLDEYDCLWNY